MPHSPHLALLRGINVGGKNLIRMAELRELCAKLGLTDVRTYIQSGNVVFSASVAASKLEALLEAGISEQFGFQVAVMVRTAKAWKAVMDSCPLPEAAANDPARLYVLTAKQLIAKDAAKQLAEKARDGEVVRFAGGCLWVHYPSGSGRSKLTPALIDRLAGSPVTTRNWKTATALLQMLEP